MQDFVHQQYQPAFDRDMTVLGLSSVQQSSGKEASFTLTSHPQTCVKGSGFGDVRGFRI